MLAHIRAVFGFVVLVLAINSFHHDPLQHAVFVTRQQVIPVRAPDHLDHIPASTTEVGFEFLDDLAVTPHRSIETLQITVDDKHQVIEHLAAGHADRTHRLRLIHLTITAECPDFTIRGIGNLARMQIFQKTRLINRHDRAETHRHRWKLPKLRHQLRVRIRRQAFAVNFTAEIQHLFFGDTTLKKCTRINTGRGVALYIEQIAAVVIGGRMPEMVEANTEHVRQRRETGNMAA